MSSGFLSCLLLFVCCWLFVVGCWFLCLLVVAAMMHCGGFVHIVQNVFTVGLQAHCMMIGIALLRDLLGE